jgi:hypothetical protein
MQPILHPVINFKLERQFSALALALPRFQRPDPCLYFLQ